MMTQPQFLAILAALVAVWIAAYFAVCALIDRQARRRSDLAARVETLSREAERLRRERDLKAADARHWNREYMRTQGELLRLRKGAPALTSSIAAAAGR